MRDSAESSADALRISRSIVLEPDERERYLWARYGLEVAPLLATGC